MSSCQLSSEEHYLDKALAFLKRYQWIYNCRNTHILSDKILENFSQEWIDHFNSLSVDELHDLVTGRVKECAPADLKSLIGEINYLNPEVNFDTLPVKKTKPLSGLSEKKAHEIELFAPVIHELCQETGSDLIVDVGCGLGHLPYLLHDLYGYRVLGLEASSKLVNTSLSNQNKQHPRSKGHVIFEQLFVTESSADDIKRLTENHFASDQKICLTGLHACADLSVEVLKLFVDLQEANALAIMPCCYHRMAAFDDVSDQRFKSFPSSVMAKKLFDKHDAASFMRRPFLRLACQQTVGHFVKMSREEHQRHARQCLYRAILQLVADEENYTVRRLKRKSGKSGATDSDEGFLDYLNNLGETHELAGPPDSEKQVGDEAFSLKMVEKWSGHRNDCWRVEVLMGLQAAIQGICENVILLDRVEFLKEKGLRCYKRKITNGCVSPRCWALIAKKSVL